MSELIRVHDEGRTKQGSRNYLASSPARCGDEIKVVRIGRAWSLERADVARWLDAQKERLTA